MENSIVDTDETLAGKVGRGVASGVFGGVVGTLWAGAGEPVTDGIAKSVDKVSGSGGNAPRVLDAVKRNPVNPDVNYGGPNWTGLALAVIAVGGVAALLYIVAGTKILDAASGIRADMLKAGVKLSGA